MEQLEGCYGCRSLARRITEADATIAALQEEIATRDSTDSILATRIRELEARLTQRTEQVAALQARVQELEAIKIPDDAFTYCAYCGEKSPVDEHNEDLAAHIKVCPKHPMRDVESQLTQRTAELEAANKLLYKKNCALGRAETIINDLQAELERVRGERDHAKKMEAVQKEVADNQTWHVQKLRTLIAALPKVEGAVVVSNGYVKDSTRCHALFGADEDAALYAALLQHRQGMEG